MALRINTNVSALNAHKNLTKTDNALSSSLEKLSSGLRINKAADDASGMVIADSLKSQSMGLGQAIRNANDGINIVQTADAALEESINIVNTIKTKAIQSAQDGQTTESRTAIQSDITKLMEELDMIATSTSFNGQKLLSGSFTNKKFQVGAYSGETVNISIGTSQSTKMGHTMSSKLGLAGNEPGTVDVSLYSNIQNKNFDVEAIDVQFDNTRENSMGAVADAINKLSDSLGISAKAFVSSTTDGSVVEGKTDEDFAINGIAIGEVNVTSNDADGALVKAINGKTSQHGVYASTNTDGQLTLTSTDGRAIDVTTGSGTGTSNVLGGSDMSTLGYVQLNQTGSNEIIVNDTAGGDVVTLTNDLEIQSANESTTESKVAAGSVLTKDTILGAGFTTGQSIYGDKFSKDITTSEDSLLTKGSVIADGSTIATKGELTADMKVKTDASTATLGTGSLLTGSSLVANTVLGAGTTIAANNELAGSTTTIQATAEATVGESTIASGSILGAGTVLGANTELSGMEDVSITATDATTGDSTIEAGSTLAAGSVIASNSVLSSGGAVIEQTGVTTSDSTLGSGSTLAKGTVLGTGTNLDGEGSATTVAINQTEKTTGTSTIGSGAILGDGTTIAAGTAVTTQMLSKLSLSGDYAAGDVLKEDQAVSGGNLTMTDGASLAAGSILANGSQVGSGSTIMADITIASGLDINDSITAKTGSSFAADTTLNSGSTIATDITLKASVTTSGDMTMKAGSSLGHGTTLQSGSQIAADITLAAGTTLGTGGNHALKAKTGSSFGDNTTLNRGSKVATEITLSAASTLSGAMTLTGDMTVGENSQFEAGSVLKEGSSLTTSFKLDGDTSLNSDMTLAKDSIIDNDGATIFKAGSKIGGDAQLQSLLSVQADMTTGVGTKIQKGSSLANGSTLGGAVTLANDEKVAAGTQMELAGGSMLKDGSTIAAGTYLTNDITTADGVIKAGTELKEDITTKGDNLLRNQMTLEGGSVMKEKSVLGANASDSNAATTEMTDATSAKLADLNVLTQESAQQAISIADAALKDLDKIRADLGSTQNQLTSTIANISTTKVNVQSAESSIREVDFAEESSNFTKLQILSQAGTFALSQANSSSQNVMSLLQ